MSKKLRILFLTQAGLVVNGIKIGFDNLGHITDYLHGKYNSIWDNNHIKHFELLKEKINDFKPDIIFSEGYGNYPQKKVYEYCTKNGISVYLWDIESFTSHYIADFQDGKNGFIYNCHHLFTTTEEKIDIFKRKGYDNVSKMMFGCSDFHKPMPYEDRFANDIGIYARNYSNRYHISKWFIKDSFVKNNYDIKIYGRFWLDKAREFNIIGHEDKCWQEHPDIPSEWTRILINSCKVILGLNCTGTTKIDGIKYKTEDSKSHCSMRVFEVLASSEYSLFLCNYHKAHDYLFPNGLFYQAKNSQEATDMADEILKMKDSQRIEKAKKARKFCIENHNYIDKAKDILKVYYGNK